LKISETLMLFSFKTVTTSSSFRTVAEIIISMFRKASRVLSSKVTGSLMEISGISNGCSGHLAFIRVHGGIQKYFGHLIPPNRFWIPLKGVTNIIHQNRVLTRVNSVQGINLYIHSKGRFQAWIIQ
jgi:hypothetical protein